MNGHVRRETLKEKYQRIQMYRPLMRPNQVMFARRGSTAHRGLNAVDRVAQLNETLKGKSWGL